MPNDKPFLFLKNQPASEPEFNKYRPFKPPKDEEASVPKIPTASHQKKLRNSLLLFDTDLPARHSGRTLNISSHFDLVKIHFFVRFDEKLAKHFYRKYGLRVIAFEHFNQTVLFSIDDYNDLEVFRKDLQSFSISGDDTAYEGKPYARIALIQDFYFLSSAKRYNTFSNIMSAFSIIPLASKRASDMYKAFISYLTEREINFEEDSFSTTVEISSLSRKELDEILDNFDIVRSVSGSRAGKIAPGDYGEVIRSYGFEVSGNPNNITVGIIDTGINAIDPIKPALSGIGYDITGHNAPFWDEAGHGTMVAGLVALGTEFLTEVKEHYTAKANVAVIKVLQDPNGEFSVNRLVKVIRKAATNDNIRLFNLSLNEPIPKEYNSAVSDYAYVLDRLANELHILIFISTGNMPAVHAKEMQKETHDAHEYPFHFYRPGNGSDIHSCQSTNICAPAESMNNVSVGALADNFGHDYGIGITPAKDLPAYYTRKFHIDYRQKINGAKTTKFHKNKYLNKPDLVFNGGDLFEKQAGIEVLSSPRADGDKYFSRNAGSSLSTPLITSMAAEILKYYPSLSVQSVKAILLNEADFPCGKSPVLFRDPSLKGILKKLIGFGIPAEKNLTLTDENSVTFIIEDSINLEEVRAIDVKIPKRLLQDNNKLEFTATLCYSFEPIRENHLNYCPLQIVFGFFSPSSAKVLANEKTKKYMIKAGVSWSEDTWAPEGRFYSNVQHLHFCLSQENLVDVRFKTTLGIKCTGKKEIDAHARKELKKGSHSFSLVINIAETPENNVSGELYNQIIAINTVESILSTDIDLDLDVD